MNTILGKKTIKVIFFDESKQIYSFIVNHCTKCFKILTYIHQKETVGLSRQGQVHWCTSSLQTLTNLITQ